MVERAQNQILRKRKCRLCLLTHILEVLKDDPAMREIFLQKLVYNEESGDVSSSAELPTKPRICDLQDTQDAYDFLQKKNKDKIKEPAKVLTFGNNKVHYLNKILILQVKTKLSVGTIHYISPKFYYSSTVPTKYCSCTIRANKFFKSPTV